MAALGLVGVFVFQKVNFIGLRSELQDARLQLIGAVLVDGKDAGLGSQFQQLHRVPHQNAAGGLGALLLGLGGAELVLHLVEVPAQFGLTLIDAADVGAVGQLLAHGFQFLGSNVCGGTGFVDDVLGFPAGGLHGLFLFFAELLLIFLVLLLDLCRLLLQALGFLTGKLHLLALLLQLGQHVLKVLVGLVHQIVGFLQNFLRKSQLPGNGKGIGLAGNANEQLVGGSKGLHVELAGGVDDALRAHGVELQFGVMGRRNHPAAQLPTEFDDGGSQRRALRRVGARAQLVEQHQRPVVALGDHVHNGAHVAGKGGQALGDRLLVADVGENGVEG